MPRGPIAVAPAAFRRTLPLALLCAGGAWAQSSDNATATLQPVVVTATRTEAAPFDVPASIDAVGSDTIRDGKLQVNISESLGSVPGLAARDRQNYAQDVQISVRGFGARSTFGIRGVRLYVDGIPATLPDGQGQISNVDLSSTDRIEVLRGPFSALYGNSSGGVIQVFTEEGSGPPTVGFGAAGGSNGTWRTNVRFGGSAGAFSYLGSASHFYTDGYRDHSAAERNIGNAKFTWRPDDASKLTLVVNSVALPEAQDPLGLSRAQYDTNPRGVDPSATNFNTRKTVDQTQAGLIYERRFDAVNSIRAMVYDGHRNTQQFQSIPVATQGNPLNPGGVIALGRDYQGTDLRWTAKTTLAGGPFTFIAGLAYDNLDEHRHGYQNFIDDTLGVQGALRRDETNKVYDFDQYAQASWQPAPAWTIDAGVRHSKVSFTSTDHYIVGKNGDDSGAADYGATLPVAGILFAASPDVHLYATAGKGFETPTLNELAYRPNGQTGLNFGLQPARSNSVEAGIKTRYEAIGQLNLALFETRTSNEIVTLTNSGGRSTYQNAGSTRRTGIELSWSRQWFENLHAQAAYTWLAAIYRDGFLTCTATPCTTPTVAIASGNRIPGLARNAFYASLGWAPPQGWRGGMEARSVSRVYVNDLNSDAAPGYAIASLNGGYVAKIAHWDLSGFARIDNLFDRKYAGSVIVNEGNGRYFEPAPGRTWLVGLSGSVSF
ncbi:MAG: TonB-dependent receptor [Proteobacteria bacterium]|nr:TonB-dependent receptor [Pseudomonadota bacterium]